MRTLVEHEQGPRGRAGRRGQGAPRRRLGAGPARPRGAGHPRLGRGRHRRRAPGRWPRSTPGASARCCAERPTSTRATLDGRSRVPVGSVPAMNVPDDLRYSTDHEWVRVEGGRVRDRHHRLRPGRARRRRVRRGARGRRDGRGRRRASARSSRTKSVSDIYAPVAGTVVEVNADLGRRPGAAQRGSLRRGVDLRDRARRPVGSSTQLLDAEAYRELDRGLGAAVADVFCNHCGHRNPLGVELLLVVRRRRSSRRRETTPRSSFHPTRRSTPADGRGRGRPRRASRPGVGDARRHAGPERRLAVRPRRSRSPRRAAIPTATSSSTTSPCRAATPRSRRDGRRLPRCATSARSTAPTSTASGSRTAPLADGDELQIGKFKLVFLAARRRRERRPWPSARTCRSARSSASCRTSSPTSRSRRSASSRARACSIPSARRRATASSTRPTSSGCAGSCASSGRTSCRSRSSRTAHRATVTGVSTDPVPEAAPEPAAAAATADASWPIPPAEAAPAAPAVRAVEAARHGR